MNWSPPRFLHRFLQRSRLLFQSLRHLRVKYCPLDSDRIWFRTASADFADCWSWFASPYSLPSSNNYFRDRRVQYFRPHHSACCRDEQFCGHRNWPLNESRWAKIALDVRRTRDYYDRIRSVTHCWPNSVAFSNLTHWSSYFPCKNKMNIIFKFLTILNQ